MNFNNFDFDKNTIEVLSSLETGGRLPHAVIIECKDEKRSLECAKFLAMYLVCTAENKPCGKCNQCIKTNDFAHPDISVPKTANVSHMFSMKQMLDIIRDAYIIPNEANAKVYIFENADDALKVDVQNAFLKTLEEPPKNVHFFLLCKNAQKLLITIRSRCTIVKIGGSETLSDSAITGAKAVINGIISSKEYDLLKALNVLGNKDNADNVLSAVTLILRDGLAILSGAKPEFDSELAQKLASRFIQKQIMDMLELTETSKIKLKQYVNINLLTTWLCGEYRRISWQR